MRRHCTYIAIEPSGFSLLELLFVLALIGLCALIGAVAGAHALGAREAKGAAQGWQAAAGWAQVGVLWHGGATTVASDRGSISLAHNKALCGGGLEGALPLTSIASNIERWLTETGARLTFGGRQASPDSGGSLFFSDNGIVYRVVVRPESGLTVRSLVQSIP